MPTTKFEVLWPTICLGFRIFYFSPHQRSTDISWNILSFHSLWLNGIVLLAILLLASFVNIFLWHHSTFYALPMWCQWLLTLHLANIFQSFASLLGTSFELLWKPSLMGVVWVFELWLSLEYYQKALRNYFSATFIERIYF